MHKKRRMPFLSVLLSLHGIPHICMANWVKYEYSKEEDKNSIGQTGVRE